MKRKKSSGFIGECLTMATDMNASQASNRTPRRRSLSTKENEDEGCPICLEPWTNSGAHRLVSTYCGHLFGKICIEQWLRTSQTCPQCQSRVRRKDLRWIFCRSIKALDTSERDNAIKERDFERRAKRNLEHEKAELQIAYESLQQHCLHLQQEHDRLLELNQQLNDTKKMTNESVQSVPIAAISNPILTISLQLEATIKTPEGMCRVLAYASSSHLLFISSQPSSNNHASNADYGVRKISLIDGIRSIEYISLNHTKPIRDIQLYDTLLLSCAWDKTLRIYNYIQNTTDLLCECSSQVWSCAWNLDDPNLVFAGLNTGRVQVFDRRQTQQNETILSSSIETLDFSTTSPILCLQYIQKSSHFHANGLLVGSNDKSGFYEYISNCEYHFHELPIDKNLSSLHYDVATNRLLASFRPQSNPARHELYEIITTSHQSFQISLQLIQTFVGSSVNIILSRSKILHHNAETYVVASDNRAHGIEIWNIRQTEKIPLYKLSTQCDIIDSCLARQYLCLLADNQLRLYKWS
ncbi:unnamed protein product [Adineta ricciae]|uniref:RING-type E3 ubiquitin transferase n=1 Tax=Adineta ricciae TaxID=249248 RepID=A0A814P630_ADIRI|nr:unnamed protein product [Adineta ricciae]